MFKQKHSETQQQVDQTIDALYGKSASPALQELSLEDKFKWVGLHAARIWGIIGFIILLVAAGYVLGKLGIAVQVLLIAFVISFLITPLVNYLETKGLKRVLGTLVAYLLGVLLIAILIALVVPVLTKQITDLVNAIPGYANQAQAWVSSLHEKYGSYLADSQLRDYAQKGISAISSKAWAFANSSAMGLIAVGSSFATLTATFFMGLVVAFWLTMDFPKFHREALVIAGPKKAEDLEIMMAVFGRAMGGYIKGLIITSACTGLIAGIGFFILGLPYAGLLGLATAILNVVPFVGPWIGGGLAALVGLFVNPLTALLSIVITIVAQQITDTFISPKVMQSAVAVHPLLVIVGLTAAGAVGGVVGMIFVVPLMAACKGVFTYYFEKRTGRQLVSDDGGVFKGKPFNDEKGAPIPAFDATGGSKYYSAQFAKSSSQESIAAALRQEKKEEAQEEPSKLEEIKDALVEKVNELTDNNDESSADDADNTAADSASAGKATDKQKDF